MAEELTDEEIDLRDRHFPGWHVRQRDLRLPEKERPVFVVVCSSVEEKTAIQEIQPPFIQATYLLR